MSFEELLVLLIDWTGRPVIVSIATSAAPSVTIAAIEGTLAGGHDLTAGETAAVAFTCVGMTAGFVIARDLYRGAGFHRRQRSTLVVRLGTVDLWIQQRA